MMAQDILGQEPGPDNSEEGSREPSPIGVPERVRNDEGEFEPFVVKTPRWERGANDIRAGIRPPMDEQEPRYYEGDQNRLQLFGVDPHSTAGVIRMQKQLVDAGLLNPDDIESPGEWDKSTSSAMKEVLGVANRTGTTWNDSLNRLVTASQEFGEEEVEGGIQEIKPFTPPSYDELAETARTLVERDLGRELKDYEVEIMADKLKGYHEEAWEDDVVVQRARRDAAKEAEEAGATETTPVTHQGIQDPALAFKAFAREHFQEEVDRDEDVQETAQNRNLALRIFRNLGEI